MKKGLIRRLVSIFPKRWLLILGLLIAIMYSLITVGFSYLIRMIIDSAVDQNRQQFSFFMMISIIIIGLNFLLSYLRTKILGHYTENGIASLRYTYGNKVSTLSFEDLSDISSGEFLSRGTNDMTRVKQFTSTTLPRLIEIPLTGLLALALLIYFSWQLTLFSLIMVPVLVVGSSLLMTPIGKASKKVQEKLGRINASSIDVIKGLETVKAYQLEEALLSEGTTLVDESIDKGIELSKKRALLESFSLGFSIVPFVTTFLLGGYFVIQGLMTPGSLLAFINLLNFLTMPLSEMAVLLGEAKRDLAAFERVVTILDAPIERTDGEEYALEKVNTMIELKDVSFSYKNATNNVISNVSLSINTNQTVAFVGPSGGGKSTLVKLILGYFDHYQGSIKIGNHEIKSWSLKALRKNIAMVSQDTYLFPDTIYENIRMGRVSADDNEVCNAAIKAYADHFIKDLEYGYETVLAEHGNSLSGGQKQRLAIARAILKNAPILVLDEATSALDTESENLVKTAFTSLAKEKTTIIIAHRLSTIEDVDLVYVIDQGKVVESGSPKTLLAKGGLYTKLYQKQLLEEGGH